MRRVRPPLYIRGRRALRKKRRISLIGRERAVHGPRDVTEHLGFRGERNLLGRLDPKGLSPALERDGPCVSRSRKESLEHRGNFATGGRLEARRRQELRRMRKMRACREKPRNLGVRVLSLLEAAIELQNRPLAEDERRVALLGAPQPR